MAAQRKKVSSTRRKPARAKPATKKAATKKAATKKTATKKTASERSKPTRGKRAMFQKVAFTMFHVADPKRARTFYEDVLGLTRGLASPDGVWTEYDLPGGGCLALFCAPDPKYAAPPGGASIAFEVADLDALNARLTSAGVVYRGGVVHGPKCRMSNIQDSEGNGIILHQLTPSHSRSPGPRAAS